MFLLLILLQAAAIITAPAPGDAVTGSVNITGTATHPQLTRYEVAFAYDPNPTDTWFELQPPSTNSVTDGVLEDPRRCDFDASSLIGTVTACGELTADDARVIQMIWGGLRGSDGSFLWYGLAQGAPLNALAGPSPFIIGLNHLRFWVKRDPAFDWKTLDYESLEATFHESHELFNDVIGTDDPDLSDFRKAGGKAIVWHGWNDQLIFPEGTIDYYDRVIREFHDTRQVQKFARLFMAPGVEHCGGGVGPNVFDAFGALVRWVERRDAPDRIVASRIEGGNVVRTRPLCPYPSAARYDGKGDPNSADSFVCGPNLGAVPKKP